jgi:hypothetical protein
MPIPNQVTDGDLIGMLGKRLWLARGGSVALGLPGTLRKALCQAHKFSAECGLPTTIVKMPNEELRILSDQINRLWNRIRVP